MYKQKKSKESKTIINNKKIDEAKEKEERIKAERAEKIEILLYEGGFLEEMRV